MSSRSSPTWARCCSSSSACLLSWQGCFFRSKMDKFSANAMHDDSLLTIYTLFFPKSLLQKMSNGPEHTDMHWQHLHLPFLSAVCVVLQVHLLSCFPSCDDLLVFAVKVPYTPWGEFWLWRTLVGYLVLSRRTCSTCPWRALRYHLLWQGIHFLHLKKQEAEKVKTANLRIDPFMSLPVCPKQRTSQSGPLLWSPSKDDKSMTFQSFRQLPRSPCYGAAWFAPWVHWWYIRCLRWRLPGMSLCWEALFWWHLVPLVPNNFRLEMEVKRTIWSSLVHLHQYGTVSATSSSLSYPGVRHGYHSTAHGAVFSYGNNFSDLAASC